MELKIYISGKITGEETETCKRKFAAMDSKLKKMGVRTVINPMNIGIPVSWTWEEAMDLCMRILKEKANTIVMLNDWSTSKGAKEEYEYAAKHDYHIFYEDEADDIIELITKPGKWIDTSTYEFP